MKKLYIHIGYHKTGTTSIQNTLIVHKEILSKNDFCYFNPVAKHNIERKNLNPWLTVNFDSEYSMDCTFNNLHSFNIKLRQVLQNNIIISAEHFCYLNEKEIYRCMLILKEHFDIKIICYLRRQDQQAVSFVQQGAKATLTTTEFISRKTNFRALPPSDFYHEYFDYNKIISRWAYAVGKENIILRIFDPSRMIDGDVVKDFLHTLDIHFLPTEHIKLNTSLGFKQTKLGHLFNAIDLPLEWRNLIHNELDGIGKMLPARNDAQAFYNAYKKSNIELNKKFSISNEYEDIFSNNFEMYPSESQDIWTEESANDVFLKIFNILKQLKLR